MTPNVIAAIRERALGKKNSVRLNEAEKKTLERIAPRWQQWAPAEVLRRRTNVRTRLRDYPKPSRILPTKLGNVLRRHEDDAGVTDQTFVQQIFEGIPLLIKIEHDEQRTRLDLYCSMVFVVLVVTLVAVARFAAHHLSYAVFAAAIGLSAMWLMYRDGVASARAYGSLLVVIARHVKQAPPGSETDKKQPK